MSTTLTSESERDRQAGVVAWFVALVHAHFRQEHRKAAEALEALEHLGVTVKFRARGKRARGKVVHHAE